MTKITKAGLKKIGIKVLKTMAQAALGVIGSSAFISEVDWVSALSAAALAGIACVLMNLKDLPEE